MIEARLTLNSTGRSRTSDLLLGRAPASATRLKPLDVKDTHTTQKVDLINSKDLLRRISNFWPRTDTLNIAAFMEALSSVLEVSRNDLTSKKVTHVCKFLAKYASCPVVKILSVLCNMLDTNWAKKFSQEVIIAFYYPFLKAKSTSKYHDQLEYATKILGKLKSLNPEAYQYAGNSYDQDCLDNDTEVGWSIVSGMAKDVSDYEVDTIEFIKKVKEMEKRGKRISFL